MGKWGEVVEERERERKKQPEGERETTREREIASDECGGVRKD